MEKTRILMIMLLFVVAVNALLAGYSFMTDPSGKGLKASVDLLLFSPFENFFIPGLILFTVNGILNFVAAILLICRWGYAPLMLILQGILLTGWIVIQVMMLREFNVLHAVFGSIGLLFFTAGIFLHKSNGQAKIKI